MHGRIPHPMDTQRRDRQVRWCLPWRLAAVIALGLTLAHSSAVQAKIFHCSAGDVPCLIAAINTANGNGQTNTIHLEAGTYTITEINNGTLGDFNGLPVITSRLTITGEGAETTIIELALGAPSLRFLEVEATGDLRLTGLTLRGVLREGGASLGGALFNSGSLTLRHCWLIENVALRGGGGIYNRGTLTLHASLLRDNGATLLGGPSSGGGLLNEGGVVRITHSTFDGNFGDGAAGLSNFGTMTIAHTTFVNNNSAASSGGLDNWGTLTITASTFVNNRASFAGGGLSNSGTLTITNSTFVNNRAGDGGGGVVNNRGILTLINSTIADNRVSRPESGGGLQGGGIVWVVNTILAGNTRQLVTASTPVPEDCRGPVTSLGHNLIGDPTGCTVTLQPTDLTGDPGFAAFTDDGTPGHAHFPLLPTSQAIDAGDDAACPRRDQLGQRRVNIRGVGTSICDIGAIEFRDKDDRQHDKEDDHHDEEDDRHDGDPATAAH